MAADLAVTQQQEKFKHLNNMKKSILCSFAVMAAITSCLTAHGSYFTTITNDHPVGYWRLDEPNTGAGSVATNLGTLGAAANGVYGGVVVSNCPGALTGDADTSCGFYSPVSQSGGLSTNQIVVPYNSAFSSRQFSFEAWVRTGANTNSGGGYYCPLNMRFGSPQAGFTVYAQGTPATWQFWLGKSTAWNIAAVANKGGYVTTNWTHLVGTYDGTNQTLYVNGSIIGVYQTVYNPNPSAALQIGAGGSSSSPSYNWTTNIDEVAFYTNALSTAQVTSHYVAATGNNPPVILTPYISLFGPAFQTNYLATKATMSVTAAGSPPFAYQWWYSTATNNGPGMSVGGATNATYVISSLDLTNQGAYWIIISNSLGTCTSSVPAWVQVINIQSPVINTQPQSQIIYAGGTAHFICAASGAAQLSYQWQYNSNNITGGTNAELDIPNVQSTNAGYYQVVIGDAAGINASGVATLEVLASPATNSYPGMVMADGPVAYWRLGMVDYTNGGGVAYDLAGGFNGAYNGGVEEGQTGAISGDADYSGLFGSGSTYVDVPFVTNLNTRAFTVELWAYDNGQSWTYYRAPLAGHNPSAYGGYNFYGTPGNSWSFWLGNGTAWKTLGGPAILTNAWTHLAVTYDGTNAILYADGVVTATLQVTDYVPDTVNNWRLGCGGAPGAENYFWTGGLDEMAVYNTALSSNQIAAHYWAGIGNTLPPKITLQPYGGSVLVGSNITLNVAVTGSAPLAYQWRQSSGNLTGQTNTSLALLDVVSTNPVSYDVVVTNAFGSVTSSVVNVTAVAVGSSYSSLVMADGAVGYWRLDETTGSVANNSGSSGSVDDGTYVNGVILGLPGAITNDPDYSAGFTTVAINNTEVQLPYDALLNGQAFTIEAWAQMTGAGLSADGGYQAVFSTRDNHVYGGAVIYGIYGSDWVAYTGTGSGWDIINSGVSVQPGQWAHVALTYDGVTKRFYVNGILAGSSTAAYMPNQIDAMQALIGAGDNESLPGAYFFQGGIDEVAVYNTCLPASSIQAHYAVATTVPYVAPPLISISQSGGNVILTWSGGTLQQSTNLVDGIWSNVTNVMSPFSPGTSTNSPAFFRVKQ
jgi:hypothetical protein